MKRDIEVVRAILLRCENAPANTTLDQSAFEGISDTATVLEHVEIMIGAGIVEGQVFDHHQSSSPEFWITKISWKGQDFLDATRNSELWAKIKKACAEKLLPVTVDLAITYFRATASHHLGGHL